MKKSFRKILLLLAVVITAVMSFAFLVSAETKGNEVLSEQVSLKYNGSYYIVDPMASYSKDSAIDLESGKTYYREYSSSEYHMRYWYAKFTVKENSCATIAFKADKQYGFSIHDENGIVVKDFGSKREYNDVFPLEAGIYYIVLYNEYLSNSVLLSYSLLENVKCEFEPNDIFSTATEIKLNQRYLIFTGDSGNEDYLSFKTNNCKKITIYVYNYEETKPYLYLYESDRNTYYIIDSYLKYDENKEVYYYEFNPKYEGTYFIQSQSYKSGLCYSIEIKQTDCLKHNLETTTTKATLTQNGNLVEKCSVCGNTKSSTIYYPKTIKLSATSYTYNGKVQTSEVTVKDSKGSTLKKDTDYTVSYEKGRKATGKYTVTVAFKGKYSGTKKLYFTIAPKVTSKVTTVQSTKAIKLTWKKVTGADGYRIYQYNTKTKKWDSIKTTTATSYKVQNLKAGTAYKFRIKAYKKDDGTIWGEATSTITVATKPNTPKITKLTTAKAKAALVWSNVDGETGYEVYASTKKNSGFKKVAATKANVAKATVSKLASGKTYYFKVRAYKTVDGAKMYSAWSAVKRVKIK